MSVVEITSHLASRALPRLRDAERTLPPTLRLPSRTRATAYVGILALVVSSALVLAAPSGWPTLVGALLLACISGGAAVMCWIDAGDNLAQAGLTLTLSLAGFSIASAVMIWLAAWEPRALLGIGVAGAVSGAVRLTRRADRGYAFAVRRPSIEGIWPQLLLLLLGVGAWAYGVGHLNRSAIGLYGLLPTLDGWFVLGLVSLVVGSALELRRDAPRTWLLGAYLIGLIVGIHATVPIVYGTPEYAWVYKHIGIVHSLGLHGRITDPGNIYQQWPVFFAAGAALAALGHVDPITYATWAPLAFELAGALVLLGVLRLMVERRVAYLATLVYVGAVSWVGQDYFSPQAFGYLLWLAIVLVIVRWLRAPPPSGEPRGSLGRIRAPLLAGLPAPPETSRRMRAVAVVLVCVLYFAVVAAHQLTPYMALLAVGGLTLLDLVRPRWLLLVMAAIALGYLAPRYGLVSHDFGPLISGGNPIQNASGSPGAHHSGAQALMGWIVRGLSAFIWLGALAAIARARKALGRVVFPAVLAFSPFVLVVMQRYGGEAIYRVYLFSIPWCALLIAQALCELRVVTRRLFVTVAIAATVVAAGMLGLYGAVRTNGVTPAELTASRWLYAHAPTRALIILPDDSFPADWTAQYNDYNLQVMPSDPQIGQQWLDEGNLGDVESWVGELRYGRAYVVFTHAMKAYADFFGAPQGYDKLAAEVQTAPGWTLVYANADATIYRLDLGRTTDTAAPGAARTPSKAA